MIESASIRVERTFRYAIRKASGTTHTLVYLLHGYGQLAEYFIRKIQEASPEITTFVAPEGMHRFYLEGSSGRVGASWMTKEARETDIRENTEILDRLHDQLLAEYQPKRVIVIGFSQGGATAARWIANGNITADVFVSWASVFPPDLSFPTETLAEKAHQRYFVLGTEDPYFDERAAEEAMTDYAALGFKTVRFEGGHELNALIIEQLIDTL
jgi:predicted esterase